MAVHHLFLYEADQVIRVTTFLGTSVFLYVGPDQLLPLASVLAAVVGVLLMVWQRVVGFFRKILQSFSKKETGTK
jgi:hypothetical protein